MARYYLPSEETAVIATIDPDAYAAGTETSDWADTENVARLLAILKTGIIVAGGTLDFKLQQATDNSGTGAKDITGKTAATLAATTDDDKQVLINLRTDELDVDNGFSFVAIVVEMTTQGADMDATLLGYTPQYGPANLFNLASVDEILT